MSCNYGVKNNLRDEKFFKNRKKPLKSRAHNWKSHENA